MWQIDSGRGPASEVRDAVCRLCVHPENAADSFACRPLAGACSAGRNTAACPVAIVNAEANEQFFVRRGGRYFEDPTAARVEIVASSRTSRRRPQGRKTPGRLGDDLY